MPTRIVTRTYVVRRPPRLAWLTSPAPAYAEALGWLRRQRAEPEPYAVPHEGGRTVQPGWPYGPQPAYAESLGWLPRQRMPPPYEVQEPSWQHPGWSYGPQPGYAETLSWLRRQRTPPPYEPAEPSSRYVGWQVSPQPAYAEALGWARRPAVPEGEVPRPVGPAFLAFLSPPPNVPGVWIPAWRQAAFPPETESGGGRIRAPLAALVPSPFVVVTFPVVVMLTSNLWRVVAVTGGVQRNLG